MESLFWKKNKMGTIFKNSQPSILLDDKNQELDKKNKKNKRNQRYLFDVIEKSNEATGYESEKEEEEVNYFREIKKQRNRFILILILILILIHFHIL